MANELFLQTIDSFISKFPIRIFHKGEIIIFQGEVPRGTFFVKSGVIKAYNLSVHGDEKPVGFYGKGKSFPGSWTYGRVPSSIYYYEAFSNECRLHQIPREEFVDFVHTNPIMALEELDHYITDTLGLSMQLNALQHSRANEKLMYTLHYLSLTFGKQLKSKQREIQLHLTHQDFANLTGLTRETAATELYKLKHQGVIDYGNNRPYLVNLAKLQTILNDQYISELDTSET